MWLALWDGSRRLPSRFWDRIPAYRRSIYFVIIARSLILPFFETTAVNWNSSPESSLMMTVDSPLISTSSGDIQRALLNVGRTTFPTLFNDALKAVANLALNKV